MFVLRLTRVIESMNSFLSNKRTFTVSTQHNMQTITVSVSFDNSQTSVEDFLYYLSASISNSSFFSLRGAKSSLMVVSDSDFMTTISDDSGQEISLYPEQTRDYL